MFSLLRSSRMKTAKRSASVQQSAWFKKSAVCKAMEPAVKPVERKADEMSARR